MHVQLITECSAQVQSLITRTRVAQGPTRLKNCASCVKRLVILASCLTCCRTGQRTLLHDLSLSPTSLVFRPSSLSLTCPTSAHSGLSQEPCEIHGGVADTRNLPTLSAPFLWMRDGDRIGHKKHLSPFLSRWLGGNWNKNLSFFFLSVSLCVFVCCSQSLSLVLRC